MVARLMLELDHASHVQQLLTLSKHCGTAQDPIIFSGTVRANLDPFEHAAPDAEMWAALRQAGLKKAIRSLPVRHVVSQLSEQSQPIGQQRLSASCVVCTEGRDQWCEYHS